MKSKKAQYILLTALIAPMWINGLLRTIALKDLATVIGIPNGQLLLLIGLTLDYLPFMIMPIYLVLSGINKSFCEASADLGATPRITFTKVIIPLSMSGIISGFLMVFTPAVSTYYISEYLGDTSTWMIGEELNLMFTKNHDYSGASVIALVLLLLVGLSVLLTNRLSKIGNTKGGAY
jgi:spermidine/putrescine transport system permease protein